MNLSLYEESKPLINPLLFYAGFLVQNYVVKSSENILFFSTIFIPNLAYTMISIVNGKGFKDFTFKHVFDSMIFSLLDFIIVYMYLNLMYYSSTLLNLMISIIPLILFIYPNKKKNYMWTLISCSFLVIVIKYIQSYESGLYHNKQEILYFVLDPSAGYDFMFVGLIIFLRILCVKVTINVDYSSIRFLTSLFLVLYSLLNLCVDNNLLTSEISAYKTHYRYLIVSFMLFTGFLMTFPTSSKGGGNIFIGYGIVFFLVSFFYFCNSKFFLFYNNRIENSLFNIYLAAFCMTFLPLLYNSIDYFINYKDIVENEENTNANTEVIEESPDLDILPFGIVENSPGNFDNTVDYEIEGTVLGLEGENNSIFREETSSVEPSNSGDVESMNPTYNENDCPEDSVNNYTNVQIIDNHDTNNQNVVNDPK